MNKRIVIIGVACALAIVMCVSGFMCIRELQEYNQAQKEYAELVTKSTKPIDKPVQKYSGGSSSDIASVSVVSDPDFVNYQLPTLAVDFSALLKTNKDCIGWIYLPSLEVSYPVVQSADNIDYIDTTFTGAENMSGCIFNDCRIQAPFVQKTILYGHNMKNGTMFHKLLNIESNPDENKDIWIYLPNGSVYHYTVVDVKRCDMKDRDVYSVSSTYSDELVLSTCIKNETRLVVIARRDWVYI